MDVQERRRYARFLIQLPVEFVVELPEVGKIRGKGVLKDISLGGAYFRGKPPLALELGQTMTLTIAAPVSNLDLVDISHIKARAEIVRLDNPEQVNSIHHGVAVNFLESPSFFHPHNLLI